jgi:hypothetical protein
MTQADERAAIWLTQAKFDELRAATGSWIPMRTERRATTAALVRCTG